MDKVISSLSIGLVGASVLMLGPLLALANGPKADHGLVLAVIPPWALADKVIDASGGRLVGPQWAPMAAFGFAASPGFAARLRQNGAWFVLDAAAFSEICGV